MQKGQDGMDKVHLTNKFLGKISFSARIQCHIFVKLWERSIDDEGVLFESELKLLLWALSGDF